MKWRFRSFSLALALVLPAAATSRAQDTACTYERCALSYSRGRVVQGAQRIPIDVRADAVPTFAAGPGVVGAHYRVSRRLDRLTGVLGLVGNAALLGTILTYPKRGEDWTPAARIWLPATTVAALVVGMTTDTRSEDHLRQAIWHYNRTLPRASDGPLACAYDECALRIRPGLVSSTIVRGASAVPVARIGPRAPRLDLFDVAGDSASAEYEHYRSVRAVTGPATIAFVGLLSGAAVSMLTGRGESAKSTAAALLITAYPVGCLGMGRGAEHRHLEQAVWLYNAAIPATP